MSGLARGLQRPSLRRSWFARGLPAVIALSVNGVVAVGGVSFVVGAPAVGVAEGASGTIGPVGVVGRVEVITAPGQTIGIDIDGCDWLAPVEAAIIDPFRPPSDPFGPGGNRGIEYDTWPGQPVGSVADGRVSFVGPVGGRRWLVVAHESGLSSTYGPLTASNVVRGQSVARGETIAAADRGLHLTARAGDRYLDPAPLLNGTCGRPRLVAGDGE